MNLEIDDDDEDEDRGKKIGQIRKILAVKSLAQRLRLVRARDQQVEQRDDGAFKFSTTTRVDRRLSTKRKWATEGKNKFIRERTPSKQCFHKCSSQ